jgi:hypothetical protein
MPLTRRPGYIDVATNEKGEIVLTPGAPFNQLFLSPEQAKQLREAITLALREARKKKAS